GRRGMGAMEFEPAQYRVDKQTFAVEIDSLVDIARKIVVDRADVKVQLDHDEQQAMLDILKIGTSAGGARPKAVIAYNPRTKEIRSGQTIAPKGFEHWLLKLDGVSGEQFGASHGYGRIEYAYHLMSTDCGIAMMDCQLLEENGRAHFMTRRFDREGHDIRHHVQTLCGIQHYDYTHLYSYSYEQLFQAMRMLRMTYPEAEQMFRRVVFNVMATNNDDHTKNFAFLLRQGGRWELAPAYDICYAYDPTNIWVSQHALSIQGKHKDINRTDLMALARQNSIRKGEDIIEEIRDIVSQWPHYAAKANVSAALTEMIDGSLGAYRFK
ncbi:MAG TPA: HipA domain-containing protein, partial [Saprospiraceae bacterium]|nr:HipA domain-containing protein [Saprospiraceae bacterium]